MKVVTIKQALQNVADYPVMLDDEIIQKPVHELVCRALFDIANHPDASERGSLGRANRARKMIFDRLVGRRRSGSHPATRGDTTIEFVDLTAHETGELNGQDPAGPGDLADGPAADLRAVPADQRPDDGPALL